MWLVSVLRPEYESRNATISCRPVYSRAVATAASTASVPLFVKQVVLSDPGVISASERAASIWPSVT